MVLNGDHYVQWNKADPKGQVVYVFSYCFQLIQRVSIILNAYRARVTSRDSIVVFNSWTYPYQTIIYVSFNYKFLVFWSIESVLVKWNNVTHTHTNNENEGKEEAKRHESGNYHCIFENLCLKFMHTVLYISAHIEEKQVRSGK